MMELGLTKLVILIMWVILQKLIISMITNNLSGLYNVGTETKTIYELASETRKVKKIYSPPHVPKNLSMNLNKLTTALK